MTAVAASPVESPGQNPAPWASLVGEIAQGDERALAKLYDATGRVVYGMALRLAGESSAAEDITLDVFLQVWRTAGTYSPARGSVIGWLATLARSRAIDWLRSSQSRLIRHGTSLDHIAGISDSAPDPERASLESHRSRAVRKSMLALPLEQRRTIELAFFGGLSHTEIAAQTGVPLGTVKTRVRLAMARMRESLRPEMQGGVS